MACSGFTSRIKCASSSGVRSYSFTWSTAAPAARNVSVLKNSAACGKKLDQRPSPNPNKKIIENSLLVASTSFKSNGTCEDSLWATLRRIRSSFYAGVWSFSVIGNEFELLFISKRISPCCQFARV